MRNHKTSNPARHLASSVPMQSLFNKQKLKKRLFFYKIFGFFIHASSRARNGEPTVQEFYAA